MNDLGAISLPPVPEQQKALLIWRLRRDLEAFKELCLEFDRRGIDKQALRELLVKVHCHYEDLRHRLDN